MARKPIPKTLVVMGGVLSLILTAFGSAQAYPPGYLQCKFAWDDGYYVCYEIPESPHLYASPDGLIPFAVHFSRWDDTFQEEFPISYLDVTLHIEPSDASKFCACEGFTGDYTTQMDLYGNAVFYIGGGGCLDPGESGVSIQCSFFLPYYQLTIPAPDFGHTASPDAVDDSGRLPTELLWDPQGHCRCGLEDAVYHTRPIKLGLTNFCTKLAHQYNDPVDLDDAVAVTPCLKRGYECARNGAN